PTCSTLFSYTTLFRSALAFGLLAEAVISTQQPDAIGFVAGVAQSWVDEILQSEESFIVGIAKDENAANAGDLALVSEFPATGHADRKSTRLNSSHVKI